jgi:hypothetical protein
MKAKDEIEFETVINELREFFDPPAPTPVKTADEIVAEELKKLTPEERAAWEAESAAMWAEARARMAKRKGPSERTLRAEERKRYLNPDDDERSDADAHMPVEPEPALTAEDEKAMVSFLGDGPFATPDPWEGFENWSPEDQTSEREEGNGDAK